MQLVDKVFKLELLSPEQEMEVYCVRLKTKFANLEVALQVSEYYSTQHRDGALCAGCAAAHPLFGHRLGM